MVSQEHMRSEVAPPWEGDDFYGEREQLINIPKFELLIQTMFEKKAEVDGIKELLAKKTATLESLKSDVLVWLEKFDKTKYSANCGTVSVAHKISVKVPKDPANKKLLFDWLKERDNFDHYATIPSASLNSLYKEELKAHGDVKTFKIPGVEQPKAYKQLSMRRK